jgi:hypothetical protein
MWRRKQIQESLKGSSNKSRNMAHITQQEQQLLHEKELTSKTQPSKT